LKNSAALNYYRKLIRFWREVKHFSYYLFGKKLSDYPSPPKDLKKVGVLDREHLIRTSRQYNHLFDDEVLSEKSDDIIHKLGKISIYYDGDKRLIEKKFTGIRKYSQFYNELICGERIKGKGLSADVRYVDYKKYIIYYEFIDGLPLSVRSTKANELLSKNSEVVFGAIQESIDKVHQHRIIFYDIKAGGNFIYKDGRCYMVDFSDSIYFTAIQLRFALFRRVFEKLIEDDQQQLKLFSDRHQKRLKTK